ncbi:MAG: D-alanyl-D-alanine carboxypeptidase [Candidatus Eisenbacteria bacterium]|uniref:serine-type D-Ala-D-Ala carboxypeptidase n=1 Tax=Eiseniibacteriota bacterium TaxID=2212470 RepID=A0A948W2W1_UNCEI|nr:D-alanyl-D-alanine carboxypeptidase [Candidatus Eisenbacteria bacterium]MBU1949339.1 D-alanyl-D-alanine carboxypeptidase [Candidatus Eisenbacteria bacterium]MBU2690412.1 D-alanyl-D-alanine carboxypeptidase [Candidatus Eisenbacteria bacterium]
MEISVLQQYDVKHLTHIIPIRVMRVRVTIGMCLLVILASLLPLPVFAGPSWKVPRDFVSAFLIEAETGKILFESNAYASRAPASTTKLMTALIVMDAIKAGRVALTDSVTISRRSRRMGGSQVYLTEGEVFTLEELMQALMIASANDASVAIAEYVGGGYEHFVEMMNRRADQMGLKETIFYNTHGLDDLPSQRNLTCAYDLAQIARELVKYPKILEWTSTRSAPFRNNQFTLNATNKLLGRIEGLDGLKTGFTWRAGFCLVGTAQQDGMRLISVILGSQTSRGRFLSTKHLIETGFMRFEKVLLCREGQSLGLTIPISGGDSEQLSLVAGRSVSIILPKEDRYRIRETYKTVNAAEAPVREGTPLGYREVWVGDQVLARIPAVASQSISRAGFFRQLWRGLGLSR